MREIDTEIFELRDSKTKKRTSEKDRKSFVLTRTSGDSRLRNVKLTSNRVRFGLCRFSKSVSITESGNSTAAESTLFEQENNAGAHTASSSSNTLINVIYSTCKFCSLLPPPKRISSKFFGNQIKRKGNFEGNQLELSSFYLIAYNSWFFFFNLRATRTAFAYFSPTPPPAH